LSQLGRKFVRTARRYRTIEIQAGTYTITAADPLPDDLGDALDRSHCLASGPAMREDRPCP
jgi:hypothetical protein